MMASNKSETNIQPIKKEARPVPSREGPPVFATCFEELDKDLQRIALKNRVTAEEINANWFVSTQVYRFVAKARIINLPVSPRDLPTLTNGFLIQVQAPTDPEEAQRLVIQHKSTEFTRTFTSFKAVQVLAKGTDYEHIIAEFPEEPTYEQSSEAKEGEEEEDLENDEEQPLSQEAHEAPLSPLAEAYIAVVGNNAPRTLTLMPPSAPNFIEEISSELLPSFLLIQLCSPNTEKHLLDGNPKIILKIIEKTGKG